MIFSSYEFLLIFLPITLFIFHLLRKYKGGFAALWFVSLASCFFYGYWNPIYLTLLLTSMAGNFFILKKIILSKKSKIYLILGIFFNLCILGYFKYRNFFFENVSLVIGSEYSLKNIFIPLGISFFTFQQIALLIDTFDKKANCKKLIEFVAFVSFFPQLIAGPIVLFREIGHQINLILKNRGAGLKYLEIGICIFSLGLFKKVVLADTLAIYIDNGYTLVNSLTFIEAWILSIGYSLQLYFDFSGYSDMAIGLGLMMGLSLPINFDTPFFATSMISFWKKWHITMTRFFMMYVYTPIALSISRRTINKSFHVYFICSIFFPIIITFFLSGLWHGAHWKFVVFGMINAVGLIINYYWKEIKIFSINKYFGWFCTMFLVMVSFIFFRSQDISQAVSILKIMFSPELLILPQFLSEQASHLRLPWRYLAFLSSGSYTIKFFMIILLSIVFLIYVPDYAKKGIKFKQTWKTSFFVAVMFFTALSLLERPQAFIYFQF